MAAMQHEVRQQHQPNRRLIEVRDEFDLPARGHVVNERFQGQANTEPEIFSIDDDDEEMGGTIEEVLEAMEVTEVAEFERDMDAELSNVIESEIESPIREEIERKRANKAAKKDKRKSAATSVSFAFSSDDDDEPVPSTSATPAKAKTVPKVTKKSAKTKVESEFSSDDDFDPTSVMGAEDPLLYVMGPDVVREPKPVLLSITSALGLATTWYLSLYPFLLNSGIAQRVDEELALADANMNPDLAWLTDLSVPLFTTYVAIQLFHEAAHRIVAAFYGVRPTLERFARV